MKDQIKQYDVFLTSNLLTVSIGRLLNQSLLDYAHMHAIKLLILFQHHLNQQSTH